MRNIAVILSYVGTGYHGWQIQNQLPTIQKSLQDAIKEATGENVYVSGCGRTDAGVHAKVYVANFKTESSIPVDRIPIAINSRLPENIAISKACEVSTDFDARFSCIKKEYTYQIYEGRLNKPFLNSFALRNNTELNVSEMNKAAQYFVGNVDFACVKNVGTPVSSTVRNMFYAKVFREDEMVKVCLCADGFLYNMVRNITGTLLFVGNGKINAEDVIEIIESKKREKAGVTVEPQGLFMTALWYEELGYIN